jgi:hypothetical protein
LWHNQTFINERHIMLYAIFEDLARAYVGPFESYDQVAQHRKFCEDRGDAAVFLGATDELPEGAFVITPEQDRDTVL